MTKCIKDRRKFCGGGPRPRPQHGFWTTTPDGHEAHIRGDPHMAEDTRLALCRMMDLVYRQFTEKESNDD